jgi:DNA-binding MarR family transcriptional regulator
VVEGLAAIADDLQLRLASSLTASGGPGLRPGFAPVLQRLRDGGLAVSRLADQLGVSPQAASRTTAALDDLGYVARTPSTTDGRSKVVALTARGLALLEEGADTLARSEDEYADLVGRPAITRLARDLTTLREGLGLAAPVDPVPRGRGRTSIGAVILLALQARREVDRSIAARGHVGVRASHQATLARIGSRGARVSDLARAQGVSRQAVSSTVQELEGRGYLERRPDPADRRGVVFVPTGRGTRLAGDRADALQAVEERYRAVLGGPRLARLARTVAGLVAALHAGAHDTALPVVPPAPDGRRAGVDADPVALERYARTLRRTLGPADAARLGALLVTGGETPGGRQRTPSVGGAVR